MSTRELGLQAEALRSGQGIEGPRGRSATTGPQQAPTIAMIVTTWPRLSQTFVLREFLGLESIGVELRIFSIKVPPDEPVHADVGKVRASVTYLAFRRRWKHIFSANLRLARQLRGRYFRTWLLGLRHIRYGNILHVVRQVLRAGYVADILRREPVTRIHAHFATAPASVAMFASELTGIPYTIAVHANDIFVKARGRLMGAKMQRAEAVVTNNEYNRQYLLSRFGAGLDSRLQCVYNGLDLSQFKCQIPRAARQEPPLILSVGRMVEKKGFVDLLTAVKILRTRGREFQVEIIGSGPLKEQIGNQIDDLGLEDRVKLLGAKTQDFVRDAYQRATVFVLPCVVTPNGDRDGIPNVLYEAMASGLPVVSTPVSAIPELIDSRRNGILVDQRSPEMLADAIDKLLLDSDLCYRLARAARATIETRFTIDRTASELFSVFQKLDCRRELDASKTMQRTQ
jgi:glycosyltransferase involved in cell wall biosynthesis